MKNPIKYDSGLDKLVESSLTYKEIDNLIRRAYREFRKLHERKGSQLHDEDTCVQYILNNMLIVLVDDKYVLGAVIGEQWLSPDVVLKEEFLWAYGEGTATMEDVVRVLSLISQELGCVRFLVGTMAADSYQEHTALARMYRAAGVTVDFIALKGE